MIRTLKSMLAALALSALALLAAAELGLAALLSGGSVAAYVAGRDPVSGTAYLLALLAFALMPWALLARQRRAAALAPGMAHSCGGEAGAR